MTDLPAYLTLVVYSGDGFSQELAFTGSDDGPIDLTDATLSAQWRKFPGTTPTEFTIEVDDAEAGEVTLSLTGEETSALKSGVWDLQMTVVGEEPRTLVGGKVIVYTDISR
jgi:hypothetical protein